MVKSTLIALALLCMLTACDSTRSLQELRQAAPTGDDYSKALASDYRAYAEAKVIRYDWWTSKYFADKGLMAAYGRDIAPEEPAQWDIPATQMAEFTQARTDLMAAIAANRSTQPEMAAAAAVAYDRWLELAHHQWDVGAIADQRDAFFAILGKLAEAHTASSSTSDSSTTAPTPVESTSTVLYFPLDSDHLGASATAALAQLVQYIQSAGNVTVNINGHADRVGTEEYNMDLSQRRARFVMQALKAAGVPETIMKYFAFGESDPAVPTADGVAEPKNRRVEIFIE